MPGSFEEINAKINRLKREGGVGYTERRVLTNNANNESKESFADGKGIYVRIGNAIDPTSVVKIDMLLQGEPLVIYQSDLVVDAPSDHEITIGIKGSLVGIWILSEGNGKSVSPGTYVVSMPELLSYVTRIETETIHPISDKYLPGVCLPVVELTTEPTAEGAPLTESENVAMDEIHKNVSPFLAKCPITSGMQATLFAYPVWQNEDFFSYVISTGAAALSLTPTNSGWTFAAAVIE